MTGTSIRTLTLLAMLLTLWAGCAGSNIVRDDRDAKLLSLTSPVLPRASLEMELQEPSDPALTVVSTVDFAHRVEAPLSLQEALRVGLQQSGVARVQTGSTVTAGRETFYDIQASQANVDAALAAFDTTFRTDLFSNIINQPPDAFFGPGIAEPTARDELALNFGWQKQTIWGGTASANYNPRPGYLFIPGSSSGSFNPRLVSQLEFFVQQPLWRGSGIAVNSAPIQITRLRVEQSAWDFKRTVMASVRSIVAAYWDLYATRVALQSVEEVLPVLEEIVRLQEEARKAQWGTTTEVAKAETQLFGFRQDFQRLQSDVLEAELRLRNLMGMHPTDGQKLVPVTNPLDDHVTIDMQQTIRSALDNDPNLVRQRLDVRIRMVEQLLAANGMRPNLDVFALYRMNGIGEDLGDAIHQVAAFDYLDWELGASFSVPLGRRQASADLRAAGQKLTKERVLLEQEVFSVQNDLVNLMRAIEFAHREYVEATRRLQSADEWVKGARLRYENPNLDEGGGNWLVQNLNEYLNSLRFRTAAATDKAAVLARYNSELVRLEERKGTLLDFFGIDFLADPCRQSAKLPPPPWVIDQSTADAKGDFAPTSPAAQDRSSDRQIPVAKPKTPSDSNDKPAGYPKTTGPKEPHALQDASSFSHLSRLDSLQRLPQVSRRVKPGSQTNPQVDYRAAPIGRLQSAETMADIRTAARVEYAPATNPGEAEAVPTIMDAPPAVNVEYYDPAEEGRAEAQIGSDLQSVGPSTAADEKASTYWNDFVPATKESMKRVPLPLVEDGQAARPGQPEIVTPEPGTEVSKPEITGLRLPPAAGSAAATIDLHAGGF